LSEIQDTDLRFDLTESEEFLHQTMRLDLNPEVVAMLEERTEGWVAGLQLAALSLAETEFSPELIQQFGGRDRYIAEYLLTEVLDHQPEEIQQFLLPTAILDRFNTELCTAVLHPDSTPDDIILIQGYQKLIETLERNNLFIISLDRKGYWYRYHHLFAQLLRQRLEQTRSPNEIQKIYSLAAHWFADHDFFEEAIQLALKGEDYTFSSHLITDFPLDDLWNQTWGLQLRNWGTQIPAEILQDYPQAALHIALAHMTRNEVKESIPYIDLVREDSRVDAEILLIDSIFIRNKGDIPQALKLATEAVRLFESEYDTWYIAAKIQVIVCLMTLGDLISAEDLAISMRHEIQIKSEGYLNVNVQLNHTLGFIQEQRGKLVEAERVYLEGLDLVKNLDITLPLIGLLQVRLGAIYYQWNDIEKAAEYCETGLAWGERTGIGDILTHGLFVLVDLAILRQDNAATKTILKRMLKLLDWPEFNLLNSVIRAYQASFDVRLGNLAPAIRWADASGFNLDDIPSLGQRVEYQSLARVRLEEIRYLGLGDQAPKVLRLVDRLIDTVSKHDIVDSTIFCWSLKALLFDLSGQTKTAIEALHQALDLAFSGGFIRIFIDLGTPMRDLLQKSLTHKSHMVYKRRILMEFANENLAPSDSVSVRSAKQDIPITLTPREFEILQLIAVGLSNKAIEERLMLSKNTVRTHIKNLYSKMGVHSRTLAVQQAREIGLI
jgi:LuxR family maltose regulon positive regulatory protein